MEKNIIWFSHGSQDERKKWFLFPFKSLTFYAPNNTFLMNIPKILVSEVCKNQCHKWVKLPIIDVLNKKYNIQYSNEKLEYVWDILKKDTTNQPLKNYLKELRFNTPQRLYNLDYSTLREILDMTSKIHTRLKRRLDSFYPSFSQVEKRLLWDLLDTESRIHLRELGVESSDDLSLTFEDFRNISKSQAILDIDKQKPITKHQDVLLVWELIREELINQPLHEYLKKLRVMAPSDLQRLDANTLRNISEMTSQTQTIIDILDLDKQVQLINLRDMKLQFRHDVFKYDYGLWECHIDHSVTHIMPLNDVKSIATEIMAPRSISLAETFQIIENALKGKNIDPTECHIKLVCCRINNGNDATDKDIHKEVLTHGLREGTKNGKKWSALELKRESPDFIPKTYIKKSEALNTEMVSVSENSPTYLDLPDLEDDETDTSCRSYQRQPVECDEINTFKRQSLIFHPDKNTSCQKASTRKFHRLKQLCRSKSASLSKSVKSVKSVKRSW